MQRNFIILIATLLQAVFNLGAQTPKPAYQFTAPVASGSTIDAHTLSPDATISASVLNDSGVVAFSAVTRDTAGVERTAVYTHYRKVAEDNDAAVGDKTILHIAGPTVVINRIGHVGFEALYTDTPGTGAVHRGVFVEKQLAITLDANATGTPGEFVLSDDGTVSSRFAVTPSAQPPTGNTNGKKTSNSHSTKQSLIDFAKRHTSSSLGDAISTFGGMINDQAQAQTPQSTPAASVPPPPPPPPQVHTPVSCPSPSFPLPAEWMLPAQVVGPVVLHSFDPPLKGRPAYDSPVFGSVTETFRVIEYGQDCKPQLVTIVDAANRDHLEIWTPAGLLSYSRPSDGLMELPGFTGALSAKQFLRADLLPQTNKRGQLLIPVALNGGGFALLLATPMEGGR